MYFSRVDGANEGLAANRAIIFLIYTYAGYGGVINGYVYEGTFCLFSLSIVRRINSNAGGADVSVQVTNCVARKNKKVNFLLTIRIYVLCHIKGVHTPLLLSISVKG